MMQDLSKRCQLYLGGQFSHFPKFLQDSLSLTPSSLDTSLAFFLYNKYVRSLSNSFFPFNYFRLATELNLDRFVARKLNPFLAKNRIDIAYLFPYFPESYSLNITGNRSLKIVVEFWEDQINLILNVLKRDKISHNSACLEEKRGYAWIKKVVSSADHIIVPTNILKNRLLKLGLSNDLISIVPVCQSNFIPRDSKYIKQKNGLNNERIIFYLGSMTGYHDLKTVILSLNKIKTKNIVLLIAGGSDEIVNRYRKFLQNNYVRIIYVGRPNSSELEYYLSAADICLAIYKFTEPSGFFPGSVIKYMLAKKAIIATDLPEIREMFKDLKAGLLVKQSDVNQLAYGIDMLLDDEDERVAIASLAQGIAENNYLWCHHNKAVMNIFNSLK